MPGPAPLGVPNFFIDSFQIPPFLFPIYQAAGIQYNVPWQVLAAINEIETDYGRNLSVSSAGAVGWMQFLPSTWKEWGVDANGDGVADPYNPVDAIFTAARYLHAAGASKNLSQAIFAYNHAGWYVQSVLLRAKLIGGMPDKLIGALTGLVEGHFPVAAQPSTRTNVDKLAKEHIKSGNAAERDRLGAGDPGVSIFAKQTRRSSPSTTARSCGSVRPRSSGAISISRTRPGTSTRTRTWDDPEQYPVPKPVKLTAKDLAKELSAPGPTRAAVAGERGHQQTTPTPTTSKATKTLKGSSPLSCRSARRPRASPPSRSPPGWSRSGCSPTHPGPRPTRRAAVNSSRAPPLRSRTSATTSRTSFTSARTSTRSSRSRQARSWSPARSSAGSRRRRRRPPRTWCS